MIQIPEYQNPNIVTIDPDAQTAILKIYDMAARRYHIHISEQVAICYNELMRRFIDNNWSAIMVTMKPSGDVLTIEPVGQFPIHDISDVEWFLVSGGPVAHLDSESLIELAAALCEYDSRVVRNEADKADLQNYYDTRIKGHTQEELCLGDRIWLDAWEKSGDMPITAFLYDIYLPAFPIPHGQTLTGVKAAIQLSSDWSNYSDRYKSLYAHRPNASACLQKGVFV